jgi:hypothetical protein
MKEYKIEITSVPDRDRLVAEIWYDNKLIAEIIQEQDDMEIEIYCEEERRFYLTSFLNAIEEATQKLKHSD